MKQQNNSLTIRIEDLLVFESLTERQNEFFSKWDNHEVELTIGHFQLYVGSPCGTNGG